MWYRLFNYSYRHLVIFGFLVISLSVYGNTQYSYQLEQAIQHENPLETILFETEDSAILISQEHYQSYLENGDTLKAIRVLNQLASLYCNRVDYGKSYDSYWQALLWADKIEDKESKAISYNGLAILFSLYERRDDALVYYQKSLELNRELVANGAVPHIALRSNYSLLALYYRYKNELSKSEIYLDSCKMFYDGARRDSFVYITAQRAYLLIAKKEYETAANMLLELAPKMKTVSPSYMVILYSELADALSGLKRFEAAEKYYQLSIETALEYKSHVNYVPDVYAKLATLMTQLKKPFKANEYLLIAQSIDKALYSSRSPKNRYLLDIKDEFRIEKERLQQIAQEQRVAKLEQEEDIWYLKTVILVISIIFILITAAGIFNLLLTRHKNEKKNIQQQRALEEKKSQEIISVKNKELTGSTLQLIAKDELLSDLKEGLKGLPEKGREVNKLIKQITLNKDQSWLSFEHRFNSVNEGFYENLKKEFPDLKPYDLKVCSLVKLDFSGKEMARLLGISPESANTARYRLRKKLGLKREDNLVEFMGRF